MKVSSDDMTQPHTTVKKSDQHRASGPLATLNHVLDQWSGKVRDAEVGKLVEPMLRAVSLRLSAPGPLCKGRFGWLPQYRRLHLRNQCYFSGKHLQTSNLGTIQCRRYPPSLFLLSCRTSARALHARERSHSGSAAGLYSEFLDWCHEQDGLSAADHVDQAAQAVSARAFMSNLMALYAWDQALQVFRYMIEKDLPMSLDDMHAAMGCVLETRDPDRAFYVLNVARETFLVDKETLRLATRLVLTTAQVDLGMFLVHQFGAIMEDRSKWHIMRITCRSRRFDEALKVLPYIEEQSPMVYRCRAHAEAGLGNNAGAIQLFQQHVAPYLPEKVDLDSKFNAEECMSIEELRFLVEAYRTEALEPGKRLLQQVKHAVTRGVGQIGSASLCRLAIECWDLSLNKPATMELVDLGIRTRALGSPAWLRPPETADQTILDFDGEPVNVACVMLEWWLARNQQWTRDQVPAPIKLKVSKEMSRYGGTVELRRVLESKNLECPQQDRNVLFYLPKPSQKPEPVFPGDL